jgi:DNA segregation ATPase FtsK/SpoIIIE, S-DNA-T family
MSQHSPFSKLEVRLRRIGGTLGGSMRRELIGGALAILGLLLLIPVLRYSPGSQAAPPLLVLLAGWTAPLVALATVTVGGVLLLGPRAGYWSAEALVGVEMFLLGLQVGTFVVGNESVDWNVRLDGSDGGLIGWAVGSLLMAALGRWLTLLVVILLTIGGTVLLLRYTPLVYLLAAASRRLPGTSRLEGRLNWGHNTADPLPHTPTFVAPRAPAAPAAQIRLQPPAYVAPNSQPNPKSSPQPTTKTPAKASKGQAHIPTSPAPAQLPDTGTRVGPAKPPVKGGGKTAAAFALRPADLLPPFDLLASDAGTYGNTNVAQLEKIILDTLEDFDVPVRVIHVETGPTVTQFGIEPLYTERAGQRRKVRVNRIVGLANDLALALAAPAVRIEAPVPGRPYVGIEVPNPDKSLVSMRGIVESVDMAKGGTLVLPLGRNTAGHPVVMDLTKAPHLLIAGATGSGKSVCINTIVTGLLMKHGPESLRFVLVDPKMVELPGYNGIPHLFGKVITDVEHVMGALTWLLLQMDDRYQLFRDAGVRNIESYNLAVRKRKDVQPLPYIVLVIDELADLMMTAADDIERQICRLAQMARATGIHLVIATQRPSTDVITGLIKANFPTRISFAVTSQIDSRVVLDTPGAETLLGRGDMLLMRPDVGKLTRLQGCFVSDDEINRVVAYWKNQAGETPPLPAPWNSIMDHLGDDQELINDAIDILHNMRTCSTSMLQRRLGLGYPKAARLMEELERRNVVGPDLGGGRGREVLLKNKDDDLDDDAGDAGERLAGADESLPSF